MEMSGRRRSTSPDRARAFTERRASLLNRATHPLARRAHIVYYLSRNGQLEHPHFMELSLLPNHQLRLKDVMDRLTGLRGKGMPLLYSWSCKRSYKNGYVWNDLSENDVIYPADGAEYVLKGSEIIPGCSERFQQMRVRNPKAMQARYEPEPETETEEDEEAELKLTGRGDTRVGTRCSRGVATEEVVHVALGKASGVHRQTEIVVDDGSPPSSSSSDPAAEPAAVLNRSAVFLNLIACGSGGGGTAKARKSGANLQRGEVAEEDARFGKLQNEDKEYFSGSIVLEAKRAHGEGAEGLKRSNSYNEERTSRGGECLVVVGENRSSGGGGGGGGVKGKCIPGRKKGSKK